MIHVRFKREHEWALKLQTFYPYGLKEKGSAKNNNSNIDKVPVGKIFPSLPRTGISQVHSRLSGRALL